MPATGPSSEAFGWPAFYEGSEAYFAEREEAKLRVREEADERRARQAAAVALRILRERGLLREDRLSYTRICELEHETGIFTGSWTDYLNALHEAELKDRETWSTTS
jgi:hypothetical protein